MNRGDPDQERGDVAVPETPSHLIEETTANQAEVHLLTGTDSVLIDQEIFLMTLLENPREERDCQEDHLLEEREHCQVSGEEVEASTTSRPN